MEDRCLLCGDIIPQGKLVCPVCFRLRRNKKKIFDKREVRRAIKEKVVVLKDFGIVRTRKEETEMTEHLTAAVNDAKHRNPYVVIDQIARDLITKHLFKD